MRAAYEYGRERHLSSRHTGALGFACLIREIEEAGFAGEPYPAGQCKEFLEIESVTTFFRRWYLIDDERAWRSAWHRTRAYDFRNAKVHRVGTTSFILECRSRSPRSLSKPNRIALKCVIPRYAAVGTLADRTQAYGETYNLGKPYMPHVFATGRAYVAMEFIDGQTLDDLLADRIMQQPDEWAPLSPQRRELARMTGAALCQHLEDLARSGMHHLDLSSSNIIVRNPWPGRADLVLIDFGANYLLDVGIGASETAKRARAYIAPELDRASRTDVRSADYYSLGVILLEILTRESPRGEVQKEDGFDLLWKSAPGLAALVEDLTEERPDYRQAAGARALGRK